MLGNAEIPENRFDYLILLSGIEPQRTILEDALMEVFKNSEKKIVLVRGTNNAKELSSKIIRVIDIAFGDELKEWIVNSETVICRSGYSTLMDLFLLNKKNIILVPTPGQSEQEYLAEYWKINFEAIVYEQSSLVLNFKIHSPLVQ